MDYTGQMEDNFGIVPNRCRVGVAHRTQSFAALWVTRTLHGIGKTTLERRHNFHSACTQISQSFSRALFDGTTTSNPDALMQSTI